MAYSLLSIVVPTRPFTLRIDTYEAKATLVDIYLHIPLADFLATQAAFLAAMNDLIPYWDIRIESARNNKDKYVYTSNIVYLQYKISNALDIIQRISNLKLDSIQRMPSFKLDNI